MNALVPEKPICKVDCACVYTTAWDKEHACVVNYNTYHWNAQTLKPATHTQWKCIREDYNYTNDCVTSAHGNFKRLVLAGWSM